MVKNKAPEKMNPFYQELQLVRPAGIFGIKQIFTIRQSAAGRAVTLI